MRPLLAVSLASFILGTVAAYWVFVRTLPEADASAIDLKTAEGKFQVDITLTFDAQINAFTLTPASILIRFENQELTIAEPIPAGEPVVLDITGVKIGANSFYIEVQSGEVGVSRQGASSSDDFAIATTDRDLGAVRQLPSRAVRVRVLRDGVEIAQQTLWSEPGFPIAGEVTVDVPDVGHSSEHAHH